MIVKIHSWNMVALSPWVKTGIDALFENEARKCLDDRNTSSLL